MQDSYHWDSDKTYIHVELTYKPMKDWTHSIYEPATRHWSMSRMSRSCENFPRDHGLFQFPCGPNSSLLTLIMELFTLHTGGSRETIYPNLVTMCDALWRDVTQYWRHTARKCLNLLRSDSILLRLWLHSFNIRNFWHSSEMLHHRERTQYSERL